MSQSNNNILSVASFMGDYNTTTTNNLNSSNGTSTLCQQNQPIATTLPLPEKREENDSWVRNVLDTSNSSSTHNSATASSSITPTLPDNFSVLVQEYLSTPVKEPANLYYAPSDITQSHRPTSQDIMTNATSSGPITESDFPEYEDNDDDDVTTSRSPPLSSSSVSYDFHFEDIILTATYVGKKASVIQSPVVRPLMSSSVQEEVSSLDPIVHEKKVLSDSNVTQKQFYTNKKSSLDSPSHDDDSSDDESLYSEDEMSHGVRRPMKKYRTAFRALAALETMPKNEQRGFCPFISGKVRPVSTLDLSKLSQPVGIIEKQQHQFGSPSSSFPTTEVRKQTIYERSRSGGMLGNNKIRRF